jgi:hypothetical protein
MTTINAPHGSTCADRFGHRVATRLTDAAAELPHDVNERLRAARMQALARRKQVAQRSAGTAVLGRAGGAALSLGNDGPNLWNRVASVLPLLALVAGLVLIHEIEDDRRASEVAEVDAALLVDDLPPAAYADPGFMQFLKADRF